MHIEDRRNIFLIIKGIYEVDKERAVTRVSGFINEEDNLYTRFEEIVYNYAYSIAEIKKLLEEIGWSRVYFARIENLDKSIKEPEKEDRLFVIAQK